MATSPFLLPQQFQQLSRMQQHDQLRKRFQHLIDKQRQVNAALKTCRNYQDMIAPYSDAYELNKAVRKYMWVYVDPLTAIKYPGINRKFTLTKLDKLCEDTRKSLRRFLVVRKPDYTLSGLMYVTEELYKEQQRIISKYKMDYDWERLLPEVDLTSQPLEKEWRCIEL